MFSVLSVGLIVIQISNFASTSGLSASDFRQKQKRFTFSDDTNQDGNIATNEVLTRLLISGAPSATPPVSHCICVPPGSCPNPLPPQPNDGTGLIDFRIVNRPATPPPTATPISCNYGLTACCQAGPYQCGRKYPPPPLSPPAAAGQAQFGEFPWQAALLTNSEVYLGSGVLVSAQHILTAAHKVFNLGPRDFKVRLGEWDAADDMEPVPAQDFAVSNVFVHENFNRNAMKNNLQNDVAIIRLATPVNLGSRSTVGTACLPFTPFANQRCYVSGWGKNDFGPTGAYQSVQRKVDVALVPHGKCQAALRTTRLGMSFVLNNASFICAGGEEGKDACTGDGGSPLVCENNGAWNVVGLVAWGIGCATAGIPGVYVNVATYLPWIQMKLAL